MEGELGQAEARRGHHGAYHQPLDAPGDGGGLRLVARDMSRFEARQKDCCISKFSFIFLTFSFVCFSCAV